MEIKNRSQVDVKQLICCFLKNPNQVTLTMKM